MTSLFDVGKSAIQAYRQSLAVTGQNIANMNTEGYMRREASLEEVAASQGGITSLSNQAGLGVRVTNIRRSFDAFLLDRARSTSSNFERMDSYLKQLNQLENMLLPSEADLGSQIGRFFASLGEVAASPGDLAPRIVAMEEGNALASSFNELSRLLDQQSSGVLSLLDDALTGVSLLAKELAAVNARVLSSGQSGQSPNSLLDLRDRLIDDIAKLTDISVKYGDRGTADVTIGSSGVGPSLVSLSQASELGYRKNSNSLQIILNPGSSQTPTSQVSSGIISGLRDAYALTADVAKDVDHLAILVSSTINRQHKLGVDLDGNPGSNMFSTSGLSIERNPANTSDLIVEVDVLDPLAIPNKSITATYNAASQRWTLVGDSIDKSVFSTGQITMPGFNLTISGKPNDGDVLTISPELKVASVIKFQLGRPQEIAAASANAVFADNSNTGEASLIVDTGQKPEIVVKKPVSNLLMNSQSPVEATVFLRNGLVGTIPAGTSQISLASFAEQAAAKFEIAAVDVSNLNQLHFELDGGQHDGSHLFNIGYSVAFPEAASGLAYESMVEVANLLNEGVLKSNNGKSFDDLGLYANGSSGSITIVSSGANFKKDGGNTAQIFAGVNTIDGVLADRVEASDIQIFSREGRHLAGSALTLSEIDSYLTVANGFSVSANYRDDYLNNQEYGYRGTSLDSFFDGGQYSLVTGSNGVAASALVGTDIVPSNATEDRVIGITMASGQSKSVTLSSGVWASDAAEKMKAAFSGMGVQVGANLQVELYDFQATGEMQFEMNAANDNPVLISASVDPNNLGALARAINAETDNTAVKAVVSSNGKRLILQSNAGEDIVLSNVLSGAPLFSARVVNKSGHAISSAVTVGGSGSGRNNMARFSGALELSSSQNFSIDAGLGVVDASKDNLLNGLVNVTGGISGETKRVDFHVDADIDSNAASFDGMRASASSANYSILLPTENTNISFSAEVTSASLPSLTKDNLNKAMVNALREQAPISSLSGSVVPASLPADGSSVAVSFAGDIYNLTMQNGEVVISGGEAGRLTAYFDRDGLLQIVGGGSIAGEEITVTSDALAGNNANMAIQFGLASRVSRIAGQEISLSGELTTLSLSFNGTAVDVDLASDGTITKTPDLEGLGISWQDLNSDGTGRVIIEYNGVTDSVSIVKPSQNLGFKVADLRVRVADGTILVKSISGDVVSVDADASSLAGQIVKLSNMPDEDLIVLVTGNGARSIGAAYGEVVDQPEREPITVRVSGENSSQIEIFDTITGHSIATRDLDDSGVANFADYRFELRGNAGLNDNFYVKTNTTAAGDSRNLNSILAFQTADMNGANSGGFQKLFNTIVAGVGASVRSGNISLEAAEANKDAAEEAETQFSGVNLDAEAAALLEYQQAYQASARILSTARELFQSLLDVV